MSTDSKGCRSLSVSFVIACKYAHIQGYVTTASRSIVIFMCQRVRAHTYTRLFLYTCLVGSSVDSVDNAHGKLEHNIAANIVCHKNPHCRD